MFEVGDKVRAFGCEGVIEHVSSEDIQNVRVQYGPNGPYQWFFKNGLAEIWHKEPSLVLVEKAKHEPKFVEKIKYLVWMKTKKMSACHYPTDELPLILYETKQEAIEQLIDSPNVTVGYTEVKVWVKE